MKEDANPYVEIPARVHEVHDDFRLEVGAPQVDVARPPDPLGIKHWSLVEVMQHKLEIQTDGEPAIRELAREIQTKADTHQNGTCSFFSERWCRGLDSWTFDWIGADAPCASRVDAWCGLEFQRVYLALAHTSCVAAGEHILKTRQWSNRV